MAIQLLFKTTGGIVAMEQGSDKINLVEDGYVPSSCVEIATKRSLTEIPSKWNLRNILDACYDVTNVKRGIFYALRFIDESNEKGITEYDFSDIRDRHVKLLIKKAYELIDSDFNMTELINFADVIRDINRKVRR